jgi:uncharacterized protein YcfL
MKKIIFTILCTFLFIGCASKCTKCKNDTFIKTNSSLNTFNAFNDERYVWESWTFSTNKVNNLK